MGKRGPMPSENPKRRNAESKPHVVAVDDGQDGDVEVPDIGTYSYRWEEAEGSGKDRVVTEHVIEREFLPETVEAWEAVWSSLLAGEFRPEVRQGVRRWSILVDRFNRGDHSVNKEILALEKEYALTWSAQKRERLKFADAKDGASERAAASRASSSRRRNLKVV